MDSIGIHLQLADTNLDAKVIFHTEAPNVVLNKFGNQEDLIYAHLRQFFTDSLFKFDK
jgi:hypothetical protein